MSVELTELEERAIRVLSPPRRRAFIEAEETIARAVDADGDAANAAAYFHALAEYARSLDTLTRVTFSVEIVETYEVEVDLPAGMSADPEAWSEADKLHLYDLIDDAMADTPAFDGVTHRRPLDADGNPGEEI